MKSQCKYCNREITIKQPITDDQICYTCYHKRQLVRELIEICKQIKAPSDQPKTINIIRCKDCKHLTEEGLCFQRIYGYSYKKPEPEDFCNYGIRK